METVDPAPPARVDQVNLIGCDERFWQLGNGGPPTPPKRDEIVLNEPVARLLAVKAGDSVMLGLPKTGGIPAESAFGRKRVSVDTMRLKVASVIPAEGLGRFGLRPNQRVPRNAYISLAALQTQLQEPGRVNAILRPNARRTTSPWHPQLADYGIHVEPSPQGYIHVTTEQMIFPPAVEQALAQATRRTRRTAGPDLSGQQHRLRQAGDPYSTITAIDFQDQPPLGPFLSTDGSPLPKLGDGQIALNTWAAQRLKARVGDSIRVTYFEPESNFGLLQERTGRTSTGGDREARRGGRRQEPHADRSRPDRQKHDRRLGPAFRDPAGTGSSRTTTDTGPSTAPRPRPLSRWPRGGGCGRAVLGKRPRCGFGPPRKPRPRRLPSGSISTRWRRNSSSGRSRPRP